MRSQEKFKLLRSILKTLGLSEEATDDIVERIVDFLYIKDEKPDSKPEFPYHIRDDFLSPAEHSFYLVLKNIVSGQVDICTKVSLSDLFYVSSKDPSKFRTYTNKIDRKHVDFLLCDPNTLKPIVGIELDDKSHQKKDRRERDEFVEKVYEAAHLPLVRFPVRHSYAPAELTTVLQPYMASDRAEPSSEPINLAQENSTPLCPKCGSEMILRTAKSWANQGKKFWGCSNYPRCHGILEYKD